jgi:competence protein ComEC
MKTWNKIPLFRLLIPLIIGIIFSFYIQLPILILLELVAFLFFLLFLFIFYKNYFTVYSRRWVFGAVINLLILVFGMLITQQNKPSSLHLHFNKLDDTASIVLLKEDIISKSNSYKCEVEVIAVKSVNNWQNTEGKAILYLSKDTLSELLTYGDKLIITGKWNAIEEPSNPAQFNYKNYLYNSGITAQQYIKKDAWKQMNSQEDFSIMKFAFVYQKQLLQLLKNNFKDEELAVISALLLGYKDLLDRETIMTYSSSGAMHVLAVSGLHVGIIYLVLNSLFFFFGNIKYGNYIKAVLLILSLWAYALLTGLSPSVLRAATMFSFIIIGSALKRETNIYNTLAASAFVLLLYNPYILLQVGFQLSYAAVLGIVYLQPKLYNLFRPSNWLLDKIWAITTVSIAAQLATFPLGMYYFHQFPNYFLLSNLFVIPLATFIINGGILLFVISAIPVFPSYISWGVNKLLIFLNLSVKWVESLPYSLSLGISISQVETVIIYSVIFLFVIAISTKKARTIQVAFCVAILFMGMQIDEQSTARKQHYFIVYDVPKERAIDFVDGNQNYFIASESLNADKSKMRFNIQHFRWEKRVIESILVSTDFIANNYFRRDNYIQFFDKKILLLDKEFKKPTNISDLHFDYIVISNKAKLDLENITSNQVIIDSSVPNYRWEQIKKECLKWDIPFYNVNTQGAYLTLLSSSI